MNTHWLLSGMVLSLAAPLACGSTNAPASVEAEESESALAATPNAQSAREVLDVSMSACAATHPLVGRDLPLMTRSHGVSGVVRVVDDCTIVISGFNYDGAGRRVELYGSIGGSFEAGVALSRDLLRPGKPYSGAQLLVRLPSSVDIRDLGGLSVWCSDVAVSFGDVAFR